MKEEAITTIRDNKAKTKLQQGQVVATISGLHTSDIVDFLGPVGFDAAWFERKHGPVDWEAVGPCPPSDRRWSLKSGRKRFRADRSDRFHQSA